MPEREDLKSRIASQRHARELQSRVRERRVVGRRDGVRYEVDGRWLLNFCGNDYLGLAQHFGITDAMQAGAGRDGTGGVASHLVCGHHAAHEALEREVAEWLQVPAALLVANGYMANLAVIQSLLGEDDLCVQDRLNHASLIDGARLAGCHLRRYPHADPEGAMRQLRDGGGAALLATDGVFSMDGDVAPLRELALVARSQGALFYVDDAHGVGVSGPQGRGSVAGAALDAETVPLQLVTLGKALGGYGAVIAGQAELVAHLAETARPCIYTTALPPAMAEASRVAVRLAREQQWRRDKLQALVWRFRERAQGRGLEVLPSTGPIQPVLCGDERRALAISHELENAGYWVAAIRPPTVAEGRSRLRVSLSAIHEPSQVDALVDALAQARERVDADIGMRAA